MNVPAITVVWKCIRYNRLLSHEPSRTGWPRNTVLLLLLLLLLLFSVHHARQWRLWEPRRPAESRMSLCELETLRSRPYDETSMTGQLQSETDRARGLQTMYTHSSSLRVHSSQLTELIPRDMKARMWRYYCRSLLFFFFFFYSHDQLRGVTTVRRCLFFTHTIRYIVREWFFLLLFIFNPHDPVPPKR